MRPVRKLNRRSFLSRVVGIAGLAGGSAIVAGAAHAGPDRDPYDAPAPMPCNPTDRDSGPAADPIGSGRGPGVPMSEANARRCRRMRERPTDNDSGSSGDLPGCGRPETGITDRDSGANGDPPQRGLGRGPNRRRRPRACRGRLGR